MAPRGFEPPTPGLKGRCSNQAELRGLVSQRMKFSKNQNKTAFLKVSYRITCKLSKYVHTLYICKT